MAVPGADAPLIERLDYFFSAPENTSAVGSFLQTEMENFFKFEKTDDRHALESYSLFRRYSEMLEQIISVFCRENRVSVDDVALEIHRQMELAEHHASPYICVSYIAGALDIEAFADLVIDVNAMLQYNIPMEERTSESETSETLEGAETSKAPPE